MPTLYNATRTIAPFKTNCGPAPRHSNTVDTAGLHNAEVIATGLAAVKQLNNAIATAVVEMDDDDEPHTSNHYRDSTFDPFFYEDNEPCCPKRTRNRVNRPDHRKTAWWKLLERRDELKYIFWAQTTLFSAAPRWSIQTLRT